MIDLHLHTTASDGRLAPAELVARAAAAGLTVMAVTDHDTIAGLAEARAAAQARRIEFVNGIEITAVDAARDIHMLAYFFDPAHGALARFLAAQRADRVRRLEEIAARLASLGFRVDIEALLDAAAREPGRSVGRPQIADALVAAGHAVDRNDAFDRLIGPRSPAFVPRRGARPEEVIALVRDAGGITSLAHPAHLQDDAIIARLAAAGLTAIEARHSDHDAAAEQRYRAMAAAFGLAISGGSDYHGDGTHHAGALGLVTLPPDDFRRLKERAA